jgi:hypothetical protein
MYLTSAVKKELLKKLWNKGIVASALPFLTNYSSLLERTYEVKEALYLIVSEVFHFVYIAA